MPADLLFDIPPASVHASYVARVVSVADPESLGRVQIRLWNFDGFDDQDGAVWARVAVPFAGDKSGAFMLPNVDDEVLVTLLNGDPRLPIVIGSLWNGGQRPSETLGGDGSRVDRWSIVGSKKTRIAIIEENDGEATISLTTPQGGPSLVLEQTSGGKTTVKTAGTTIEIGTDGVSVDTPGNLTVKASQVDVTAGSVNVNSAQATFSGAITCVSITTSSVTSAAYSLGAGNVW